MNKKELIKKLNYISQKAFCSYTFYRAEKVFNEIKGYLKSEDAEKLYRGLLNCDPNYPDSNPCLECKTWQADTIKRIIKDLEEN